MELTESWIQIISLFLANAGLIIWFRAESRADWRHMDAKIDAFQNAVQQEIKDFHIRLEKQDAEFRGIMALQDEKFKSTMALQDERFKAHMMQHHK